jgi:hypothetical protein
MSNNDGDVPAADGEATPPPPKLSHKEQARQLRRAAYQKAKAQRANDPRLVAIKEAMKQRRRAAYQEAKARRTTQQKERQARARASKDAAMNELVTSGTKPG